MENATGGTVIEVKKNILKFVLKIEQVYFRKLRNDREYFRKMTYKKTIETLTTFY
jgi:hypothetical protein